MSAWTREPPKGTVVREWREGWHDGCNATTVWMHGYHVGCPECGYRAVMTTPVGGEVRRDVPVAPPEE